MAAVTDTFAQPLVRLRRQYAESRLPAFLRWWGGQLAPLVPARWRALLLSSGSRVHYQVQAGELQMLAAGAQGERELLRLPLARAETLIPALEGALSESAERRPRWLLLPAEQVLRRRLMLPLAAADRLHDVLAFELDRQTPFRADQVVFDQRVLGRDETARQLQVELVVLPKTVLEAALAPLPGLGLDGVDVRDADGRPLGVNLLPAERRLRRRDPVRWLNLALIAVAALALMFVLGKSLDNREQAVETLREKVEAQRTQARQASALREQLVVAAEGANFLDRTRAARPTLIELLTDLTHRLPDGTWLERLAVNEGRLSMVVYSNEAPALVKRLQESPYLRGAALTGTVQADPRSGRDRFTITAELAPAPAGAPAANPEEAPDAGDAAP